MVVWMFAWRVEPVPWGPPFGFAKQFIDRIDCVGSAIVELLSFNLAREVTKHFCTNLGLNYTIFYGVLTLVVGTLQWYAIGKATKWVAEKYGKTYGALLCSGLGIGVLLAFVSWAFFW